LVKQQDRSFVVLVESEPVCWAWNERQNERCAELAMETVPAFRRRGFARQAAAAWAAAVIDSGRVVFYSYRRTNSASAWLADSLGVAWFANCAAFD
jgi:predicted GNAT family acetyltransferase